MCSVSLGLAIYSSTPSPFKSLKSIPLPFVIISCISICINDFLFTISFRYIEPEVAKLISYACWPTFSLLGMVILKRAKIRPHNIIGILLAIFGVYILLSKKINFLGERSQHFGYLLPVLAASFWATYNVYSKLCKNYNNSHFIAVFSTGLFISLTLHLCFESFILPSPIQLLLIIILATTSHFFAYLLWTQSIKYGNFAILTSICHFNPVVSVLLLSAFGFTEPSNQLWIATFIICLGCFISNFPHSKLVHITHTLKAIYQKQLISLKFKKLLNFIKTTKLPSY